MSRPIARLRTCVRVGEAWATLLIAVMLIRHVRFSLWQRSLGSPVAIPAAGDTDRAAMYECHRVVAAVERASRIIERPVKCLPRAMATYWMLRRRGYSTTIIIGVARGARGGITQELHAWVELNGAVLIGDDAQRDYVPLVALARRRLPSQA